MNIQAIDVHGHFGTCAVNGRPQRLNEFASAGPEEIIARARSAGICLTVVSPLAGLFPRHAGNPFQANIDAVRIVSAYPELLQWVIVDPLKPETYSQAADILRRRKCAGMKIHPEEHGYHINDHAKEIFEFAQKNDAVIQTHSGETHSLPGDFVRIANDFPHVKLILSHLGCGFDEDPGHQVRAIQESKHGNVFTDTSSAKSITPGLIEWAVSEIGAERVLFGTDTPLYFSPMQRARIDHAAVSEDEKKSILRDNAIRILKLAGFC